MAIFANDDEEVAENVGGGSGSAVAGMGGKRSAASLDLGGDDLVDTALQGVGGGLAAERSAMASMPGVLGDETSISEGDGGGGGDASPSRDGECGGYNPRYPRQWTWAAPPGEVQPIRSRPTVLGSGQRAP